MMASIFTGATPGHRCRDSPSSGPGNNVHNGSLALTSAVTAKLNLSIPVDPEVDDSCVLVDILTENGTARAPCEHGWVYSQEIYQSTTITEVNNAFPLYCVQINGVNRKMLVSSVHFPTTVPWSTGYHGWRLGGPSAVLGEDVMNSSLIRPVVSCLTTLTHTLSLSPTVGLGVWQGMAQQSGVFCLHVGSAGGSSHLWSYGRQVHNITLGPKPLTSDPLCMLRLLEETVVFEAMTDRYRCSFLIWDRLLQQGEKIL
jgi:hypothetical protein